VGHHARRPAGAENASKGLPVADNASPTDDRTTAQIEADLSATRARLAASVSALIDQVHPNRIKQRQVAEFKLLGSNAKENAKSLLFNARGDLRTDRLTAVGGALAGLVSFVLIIRAIGRRARRS
jgi:hypothetical protein